jgi:hypothetical protein
MVEVDFSGNFLNSDNCKANDLGIFVNEGEMKPRSANGNTWNQLTMTVNVAEKEYAHSFRSAEGKRFQEAYGKDTKDWVEKKFKVVFIPYVDNNQTPPVVKQGVELIPVTEETQIPKETVSVQA